MKFISIRLTAYHRSDCFKQRGRVSPGGCWHANDPCLLRDFRRRCGLRRVNAIDFTYACAHPLCYVCGEFGTCKLKEKSALIGGDIQPLGQLQR